MAEDVLISVNPRKTTARAPLNHADEGIRNQGKPEVKHASCQEEQQIVLGRACRLSCYQRQFAEPDDSQKRGVFG